MGREKRRGPLDEKPNARTKTVHQRKGQAYPPGQQQKGCITRGKDQQVPSYSYTVTMLLRHTDVLYALIAPFLTVLDLRRSLCLLI